MEKEVGKQKFLKRDMLIKGMGTMKSGPYKLWISKWSTIQSPKVKMASESETW